MLSNETHAARNPSDDDRSRNSSTLRLLIWGAGGHAKVVADVARSAGHIVVGHIDGAPQRVGEVAEPGGARILYDDISFRRMLETGNVSVDFDAVAMAIGANPIRLAAIEALDGVVAMPSLVHPSATLSPSCRLGAASVVMPHVVVNAAARIGPGAILNTGCVVEHDCVLAEGVHVSPNATIAGGVRIGRLSWIGAGATIIEQRTVGESVIVGAGSVVIRDVGDGLTVVGSPARVP